ncbi:tripartite tricarboxylate transporter substrate binding protein [Microbacteriaceae bacterium K1510]|nr:tripartite tricarboxylate transporter substrate binding protein [Microbacteriaceae bacterium K1510]
MFQVSRFVAAVVCVAMAACGVARAQSWPARPVTIIVPFAAGGTTDIVGRIVAQRLTVKLGQNFIIENVGGAGGNLGAAKAAQAAPDGYTVFMATVAHTMAPGIYKSLSYNFQRDFEPVTVVATVPNLLIVNPDLPAKNVAELIAYIKGHPHQVNFGSAGIGSTEHMSAELFRSISGTDIVHVPYRGGAPMMADLVSGHIQMAIETSGSATPFIKGDKVRALAVSPAKRSPLFPDLPTLAESGLNGYDVTTWYGFLFPKGTPEPIRQKLYEETAAILKDPDLVKHFNDIGAEPGGNTPAQFTAFIQGETDKWVGLAKKAGIQAE